MATYLAEIADLAIRLGKPVNDPNVELALRRASNRFRGDVNHPVHRVTADNIKRNGRGTDTVFLPAIPVTVHSVTVDGVLLDETAYQVDEDSGIIRRVDGYIFQFGLGNVAVNYDHGWAPENIPGDIQDAVLEHAVTLALVYAHLQQNSAGSTQESYSAAATVGTTATWVAAVERYQVFNR